MKKFIEEFKAFALRGNVMDMAIGVLIAGAFSGIITSLTDNFINPIISMIMSGANLHSGRYFRICFKFHRLSHQLLHHGPYSVLPVKSCK